MLSIEFVRIPPECPPIDSKLSRKRLCSGAGAARRGAAGPRKLRGLTLRRSYASLLFAMGASLKGVWN